DVPHGEADEQHEQGDRPARGARGSAVDQEPGAVRDDDVRLFSDGGGEAAVADARALEGHEAAGEGCRRDQAGTCEALRYAYLDPEVRVAGDRCEPERVTLGGAAVLDRARRPEQGRAAHVAVRELIPWVERGEIPGVDGVARGEGVARFA